MGFRIVGNFILIRPESGRGCTKRIRVTPDSAKRFAAQLEKGRASSILDLYRKSRTVVR